MVETYRYLQEIINDTEREIKIHSNSPNIGKKGCLRRLCNLKIIMEKEMIEIGDHELEKKDESVFNIVLVGIDEYTKLKLYLAEYPTKDKTIKVTREIDEALGFSNDKNDKLIQEWIELIKTKVSWSDPKVVKVICQSKYKIIED